MRRVTVGVVLIVAMSVTVVAAADIPLVINHQGMIKVNGVPYTGGGEFRFGFYDAAELTWLWTNDGSRLGDLVSNAPYAGLSLTVTNGNYSVRLGQSMTAIPSSVFNGDNIMLRVYFDDGTNGMELLAPDQPVTSGAYAFHAHTADTVPGFVDGGVLSNDTTDATNCLHITDLICRDDQNKANIEVAAMSKAVNATWVAGDGNGGLDAGTVGTSQVLIYVYAIGDSTGQNPGDILFSKSGITPGLPTGYDVKRFIGARLWTGTEWIEFLSEGQGRRRTSVFEERIILHTGMAVSDNNTGQQHADLSGVVPAGKARVCLCSLSAFNISPAATSVWLYFWQGDLSVSRGGTGLDQQATINFETTKWCMMSEEATIDWSCLLYGASAGSSNVDFTLRVHGYVEAL